MSNGDNYYSIDRKGEVGELKISQGYRGRREHLLQRMVLMGGIR